MTAVTKMPHATSALSAMDRPTMTPARGMGSDRSRSCTPVDDSSATPDAALMPDQRMTVTRKPGTRKFDVVEVPAGVDGPAEHVAEHEQEQGALDAAHEEDLRRAEELQDGAPRGGDRGGGEAGAGRGVLPLGARAVVVSAAAGTVPSKEVVVMVCSVQAAAAASSSGPSLSMGWPVRPRKTSSRVGRRSPMSSEVMPPSSSRRTTVLSWLAPSSTATVTRWVSRSMRGASRADGGERVPRPRRGRWRCGAGPR